MIDILATILVFNLMMVILKLFNKYGIDNLQAIVVNYITAGVVGLFMVDHEYSAQSIMKADWFNHAALVGLLFIFIFNLLAIGTQRVGLAVTTVANKMSVVIPVVAAFMLYDNETPHLIKILGILLALVGIYLTSTKGGKLSFPMKYLWVVLVIFIGQGIADVIFNNAQKEQVGAGEERLFFIIIFLMAALLGGALLIIRLIQGKSKLSTKSIVWGIGLGIPNYFSLEFFFGALETPGLEASQVYPIVSMGMVILSAILGIILFREKLSTGNWIGVLLAIGAIAAIGL